jgi:hypothetical protein
MSEFGETIYLSESKSVMRYSWKRKDVQLNKFLLAESFAAITASHSPLGHHPSPSLESVAVRKPSVHFCRLGFLLRATILLCRLRWVNLRRKVFPKRL